ncbi:UDP-N-acetylmuramoyl-L-alanine--D-glutamate ligase [Raoultibacter phocaeensis]|uniref:UDP-N-acetylmuramoyl-L-alanine--D-glutamate ligase n=1 Tax=Raoultibacter phocaeensis TaxID=2479841 RepID=UPI00111A7D30|nr:UDP-N-acetylmuramoyl-L-alanine--D-glutamate ligase [Raoultibacter phocaeensis]
MGASASRDSTKKYAPKQLGRVLVLGLGKSGKAATSYLCALIGDRVESVTVAAGDETADARAFAAQAEISGARVLFDHRTIEERYDLCIVSPGISQFSDFYRSAAAASTEIASEVEFAWRESAAASRWVAVTGTNGKTTTTALIAHILKSAGIDAAAVGNIGDTCLEAVGGKGADIYVAETSSYQLASTTRFAPDVAVVLNITPDHVSWHRTFENYRDAKFKVLENLASCEGALAVLDATDEIVRAKVREFKARAGKADAIAYVPLGAKAGLRANMREVCGSENAAYLDADVLVVELQGRAHRLVRADELLVKGGHNVSNALAAASAALALGVSDEDVCEGLRTFAPLEHRIEPCGTVGGVAVYNDSKATNVDATLHALDAFGAVRPIVLLGGDDKGTELSELVAAAERHCKAVVCFGAAGPRFAEAFSQASIQVLRAPALEGALDAALAEAVPGDVIVLSPACASFDEFTSFEHRGRVFKDLVRKRAMQKGAD